ncbi:unnamed protein product [Lupinus luteus]|uniref:Uncharacterized protein n=1 Tax=Lupinus luteus TaxID=3873 RepID=A0AAV1X2H5_LUPLU
MEELEGYDASLNAVSYQLSMEGEKRREVETVKTLIRLTDWIGGLRLNNDKDDCGNSFTVSIVVLLNSKRCR